MLECVFVSPIKIVQHSIEQMENIHTLMHIIQNEMNRKGAVWRKLQANLF